MTSVTVDKAYALHAAIELAMVATQNIQEAVEAAGRMTDDQKIEFIKAQAAIASAWAEIASVFSGRGA